MIIIATVTSIIECLEAIELDVDDMRGQGYDNGPNMRGRIIIGVQKNILDKNPHAFFVLFSNLSLNLVVNEDASNSISML